MEVLEDHLAARARLRDLHEADADEEEAARGIALFADRLAGLERDKLGEEFRKLLGVP